MKKVPFCTDFEKKIRSAVNGEYWVNLLSEKCKSGVFECYEIPTATGLIRCVLEKQKNRIYVHAFQGQGYTEAAKIMRIEAEKMGYKYIVARVSKEATGTLLKRAGGCQLIYSEYEITTGV